MTNDAQMSREKLDEILKEHAEWVESDGNLGKKPTSGMPTRKGPTSRVLSDDDRRSASLRRARVA